jgi:hypothetical protein
MHLADDFGWANAGWHHMPRARSTAVWATSTVFEYSTIISLNYYNLGGVDLSSRGWRRISGTRYPTSIIDSRLAITIVLYDNKLCA